VVEAFADAGLSVRPNLATNYLETIAMLVGIGLGWSVLPRSMVNPPLVILETDGPELRRRLGYLTNPRRSLSNAARAFRDVLLEHSDLRPDPLNRVSRLRVPEPCAASDDPSARGQSWPRRWAPRECQRRDHGAPW
jgi:hypothetical protein